MRLTLSAPERAILCTLPVLFAAFSAFSQTNINTPTVEGNWTKDKSPYQLVGSPTIPAGKTLTIEPGVTVLFGGGKLTVAGTLKAEGTLTDSIKFDGQLSSMSSFQQEAINVTATSQDNSLKYVQFNRFVYLTNNELLSTLTIRSSGTLLDNCTFTSIGSNAIKIDNASPIITNSKFQTGFLDIVTSLDNLPGLEQNGLLKYGLLPGMTKDVTLNKGNYYKIEAPLTVPQGRTLSISPGVQLQFSTGKSQVTVEGTLKAEGTVTDSIRFVPYLTGGSGAGPILFSATSTNNSLKFANVTSLVSANNSHFGCAVVVISASTTISNNFFNSTTGNGIFLAGVLAPVQNNKFVSINADIVTNPEFTSGISGNGRLKIALIAMSRSFSLPGSNAYSLVRPFVIPALMTLAFEPGSELMLPYNSSLTVLGTLKAEGTVSDSVRITGQGTFQVPAPSGSTLSRGPIIIEDGSINTSLKYVAITNLGYEAPSNMTAAIVIRSPSATISNSSIRNINGAAVKFDLPNPQLNTTRPQVTATRFSSRFLDVITMLGDAFRITPEGPTKIGLLGGASSDVTMIKGAEYSLLTNVTVPASTTLTMQPGTKLNFLNGLLTIRGTLNASGTPEERIMFQGIRTNTYGFLGYQFGQLNFMEESQNGVMKNIDLDGFGFLPSTRTPGIGSGVIRIRTSSVRIEDCNFTNLTQGGIEIFSNTAQPVLRNNNISSAYFDAVVGFDHLSLLEGNTLKRVAIEGMPMLKDATMKAEHRYFLMGSVFVSNNRKLTIQPGVTVEFLGAVIMDNGFAVGGTIEAIGTAAQPINFLSSAIPYDGTFFGGIQITAASQNSIFSYVNLNGLGLAGIPNLITSKSALEVLSPSFTANNITIKNSTHYGLLLQAGAPITITNSCIIDNRFGGVRSAQGANRFINTNFARNTAFAINNTSTNPADVVTATNCWWGHPTGPNNFVNNYPGLGDVVSDNVNFTPWSAVEFSCNAIAELPLPIKLRSFKSVPSNGSVINNWQTESEVNAGHFILQRSYSGNIYEDIAKINAVNQRSTITSYSYTDNQPGSGVLYYRLKMVDKDGTFSLSNVNIVDAQSRQNLSVFPNPVKSMVQLRISSEDSEDIVIRIVDVNGKVIKLLKKHIDKGVTTLSIPAGDLLKGMYFLEAKGKNILRGSFVKQ